MLNKQRAMHSGRNDELHVKGKVRWQIDTKCRGSEMSDENESHIVIVVAWEWIASSVGERDWIP